MQFPELAAILQAAVSPVILISGVGLLILSMTNRFGRVLDRSRQLGDSLHGASAAKQKKLRLELEILLRRARLLRAAVTLATLSVLSASSLVITLFITAFLKTELTLLITMLFTACLSALILSLLKFLQDINLSLAALKLELELMPHDEITS